MCVSVYTCVHVWCVCVRVYACAGMCVYVCARMFVYVVSGVCVSLCVYVCVCACMCVHMWRRNSLEKSCFQKGVSVDGYSVGLGGWLGSGWGLSSVPFVGEAGTVRTSLPR